MEALRMWRRVVEQAAALLLALVLSHFLSEGKFSMWQLNPAGFSGEEASGAT